MSQLLPPAAAAAATAEDEEGEVVASPDWGGGDEDASRRRRGCEGRHRSEIPRSDFLVTRMGKSRHLRAAVMEDEEVVASLGGRHQDQDIPQVFPRQGGEGSQRSIPCDGKSMDRLRNMNSIQPHQHHLLQWLQGPIILQVCHHQGLNIKGEKQYWLGQVEW